MNDLIISKTGMGEKEILIETERMLITEFNAAYDVGMFELDSDKEVHQFLGNKPFKNIEQSRDLIGFIQQQYIENGIGRWAILDKATREFVGWTGFKWIRETINHHSNYYDFGYRLKRKFWGKGYATEASMEVLRTAFGEWGLEKVVAIAREENRASTRVMEKIGMIYSRRDRYYENDVVLYALEAPRKAVSTLYKTSLSQSPKLSLPVL